MINSAKLIFAVALILAGLYLAVFGNTWGPFLFEHLETTEVGTWLTLLVPFLPMVFIGGGAVIFTSARSGTRFRL